MRHLTILKRPIAAVVRRGGASSGEIQTAVHEVRSILNALGKEGRLEATALLVLEPTRDLISLPEEEAQALERAKAEAERSSADQYRAQGAAKAEAAASRKISRLEKAKEKLEAKVQELQAELAKASKGDEAKAALEAKVQELQAELAKASTTTATSTGEES